MNFKGVRLPIIVLALVVALAVLFAGRWLYLSQTFDRPLDQALHGVPGVVDVIVTQRGDAVQVRVKAADAPKLEEFVAELWRAIDASETSRRVELTISDSRTPALEDAYYSFHYYLQEAVATGRFSDLPDRLAQVSKPDGVGRSRVFVGPDHVFVQFHQGESTLYEIVPRATAAASATPVGQGQTVLRQMSVAPWGG